MSLSLLEMRNQIRPRPVSSLENLRRRVDRLLIRSEPTSRHADQLSLDLLSMLPPELEIGSPRRSVAELLDFISDSVPDGDVYLFGGLLRDIAFFGKSGFNSDIDLVVDGGWQSCLRYLESLGAVKNKFGGYRLSVAGWPIDIWSAEKTWAFTNGFVKYKGIGSLTQTTILNWDAILMNWRTGQFICKPDYLENINARRMDVVLEQNPNPLGMAVRVLRHLSSKDALQVTARAAAYMAKCVHMYSLDELRAAESASYRNTFIDKRVFQFFEVVNGLERGDIRSRFETATEILAKKAGVLKPCEINDLIS